MEANEESEAPGYLTKIGLPIYPLVHDALISIDVSHVHLPNYGIITLFQLAHRRTYLGFKGDIDKLYASRTLSLLSCAHVDASWYQALLKLYATPDSREFLKKFGVEKAVAKRQEQLRSAVWQMKTEKAEKIWAKSHSKHPERDVQKVQIFHTQDDKERLVAYRCVFFDWMAGRVEDPGIFMVEEIEYWAKALTPFNWKDSLETLRPWVEEKLAARAAAAARMAATQAQLAGLTLDGAMEVATAQVAATQAQLAGLTLDDAMDMDE